tara:strand:+ start:25145 stop:26056 length:912 start_codon:yes stop_codon:yes gene_type:complete
MKGNLIITVGISGSGKSTWAHEKWINNPSKYTIVNRDKIRELMFGFTEESIESYYLRDDVAGLEKKVTRYEDTLINEGLSFGKTVIVDATHLTYKHLERFKYWNVPSEVLIFEIEKDIALNRDSMRSRSVGENIINKQYSRFMGLMTKLAKNPIDFEPVQFIQNPDADNCILFDIDGTLAHMNRDTRSPYDWDRVGEDSLDYPTAFMAHALHAYDAKVIVCTGRDAICIEQTEAWLNRHGIPSHDMYMRPRADQRPDWVVKEEMWRKIAEDNYILGMFDDRLQVVRRARALGLKVFNVAYNNF